MTDPFVLKFWTTRKNSIDPSTFIGDSERLFYNPITKSIRISDGQTPGGLSIIGSTNIDGGGPGTNYGGINSIDGGGVEL